MQPIQQTVTQQLVERYTPKNDNPLVVPLRILVPGDDDQLSPWPSPTAVPDNARQLFERASDAFTKTFREEGWVKEAPTKFEYTGKRNKHGMPDKRTKVGKAWYQQQREEELKAALRKVLNHRSIKRV